MSDKNLQREKLFDIRKNILDRDEKNKAIKKNLIKFIDEKNIKKIFSYVSINSEVDTTEILEYYYNTEKSVRLYVPFTKDKIIISKLNSIENLKADKLGNIDKSFLSIESNDKIDAAIIPMLGFNKMLFRIGYGGGYYDKFLAQNYVLKVGLAFDEQQMDDIIIDSFDIPLDFIITPTRILGE